jgi:uncharacterized protein YkwD
MARTATRDRRHARQLAGPRTYQPLPLGLRCLSSLCGMCPIQPHRSPQGMARLACAALLLLLAACGGGGGDDAGDTTPAAAGDAAPSDSPTPAPGPETAPVTEQASCGIPDFAAAALAAVNQRRAAGATCGSRGSFAAAAPLRWSSQLAVASAAHSADMAAQNYFSHTSADGRSMTDRVNATGYSWASLGENIAAGYSGIDSVVEGWMRSEGHCANIMDPAFDEMALACAIGAAGSRYGQYWTQNLARKR